MQTKVKLKNELKENMRICLPPNSNSNEKLDFIHNFLIYKIAELQDEIEKMKAIK